MGVPSLSIVIPSYNGRHHLERCLPTVKRHAPTCTQVVVVDDASSDDTVLWLRLTHPWVEVVPLPTNQGFCRAVNAGIAHSRGDIVELLNNDTEVESGWSQAALRHFDDPTVGSVAPLVLRMDDPSIIDSAGIDYHICGWARNRGYAQKMSREFEGQTEVFGPSGSSGFYRRQALQQVGGMLPEYGAYFEDVDLAFRLRWAGQRCIYEPGSRVLHQGSASYGRQSERLVRLLSRNEELVFWLNLPAKQLLLGLAPHFGFVAFRVLRKMLSGQLGSYLRGKREALALMAWVRGRRRVLHELARGRCAFLPLATGGDVVRQGLMWLRLHERLTRSEARRAG